MNTVKRFLSGTGQIQELILKKDWTKTSLGPMETWPHTLNTALNICINSGNACLISWGKDMIMFGNEAFCRLTGAKPSVILGANFNNHFTAMWQTITIEIQKAFITGDTRVINEQVFLINRNGIEKQCCINILLNPLFDEKNDVAGVILTFEEMESASRKKLEEDEERLKMAITLTDLGTWDYNPNTGEVTWSDECRAIFHYPQKEKIDLERFKQLIHPDDKEYALTEISKCLSSEEHSFYDISYRILRYDDQVVRWIRAKGKVYFNEFHKADRFIGTVVDITDHKSLMNELEESHRLFKAVADTAPVMIWTTDEKRQYNFFNKGWLNFTGRSLEQEAGNKWMDNIHPDDKELFNDIFSTSFSAQKKYSIEYRLKRHDGKYRWVSDEGAPRYSPAGEFLGYIGASVDIQERKMAREELEKKVLERTSELNKRNAELKEQKEFVDTILESSVDLITVLDRDLKYIDLNRSACEMYKVKKEDLIGKRIIDLYPHIEESGMYADLKNALTGKIIHRSNYRSVVLQKNLENFYIPLKDRNGNVYGVLILSHDNTAIIEATEKLKQANKILEEKNLDLERSNKELESFSYVASHDLQEPLRKIRTFAELVQHKLHDEKTVKEYFAKIDSSAQRMGELIKAVLNYSRLSQSDDQFLETDLNGILKNVCSDYELLIDEKGVEIDSAPLPVIKGIPLQLNQLFANLIGNSIKFTEAKPKISISSKLVEGSNMPVRPEIQSDKTYAELVFKDNGIGFEQHYSQQIFTIFKRLHGMQNYSGTGIGLALCKKIVENHKGHISVISQPGQGSEFYVYLPVK